MFSESVEKSFGWAKVSNLVELVSNEEIIFFRERNLQFSA